MQAYVHDDTEKCLTSPETSCKRGVFRGKLMRFAGAVVINVIVVCDNGFLESAKNCLFV